MNIDTLRTSAPAIRPTAHVHLPEPEHFVLDNLIPVYCVNAGDQEVIKIDLIFETGFSAGEKPLISNYANSCLREGTKSYTSEQIAETLDSYGATLSTGVSRDDARVMLFCLNKHLEKLLPVFGEIVLSPAFPETEVKTILTRAKQDFQVEMEKVKFLARRNFGKLVFGQEHPYGKYADIEDYDRTTASQLADYYNTWYRNQQFQIIVSGKIPKNIRKLLNGQFGQHPAAKTRNQIVVPEKTVSASGVRFIEKQDALQSGVNIGKTLFNLRHPDFIRMQVVNTVLGGYFGSRLMTNIREDKGYTYGINSHLMSMQHAGLFFIATQVGTDVTQQAMDEVFKEIDRLRNEPVHQEELDLVKNYMLGVFLQHADGPFAQGELLKSALDYQLDLSYYQKYIQTIKSITKEEIQDLAVKYLDPGSMLSVVVGTR